MPASLHFLTNSSAHSSSSPQFILLEGKFTISSCLNSHGLTMLFGGKPSLFRIVRQAYRKGQSVSVVCILPVCVCVCACVSEYI